MTSDTLVAVENATRRDRVDSERASDEESVTITREYDTSLPVDSVTGTPPLARESIRARRVVDVARQVQVIDRERETIVQAGEHLHEKTTLQEETTGREEVTAEAEKSEKRGLNVVQRVAVTAGGLAMLGGLLLLIRKLKQRV